MGDLLWQRRGRVGDSHYPTLSDLRDLGTTNRQDYTTRPPWWRRQYRDHGNPRLHVSLFGPLATEGHSKRSLQALICMLVSYRPLAATGARTKRSAEQTRVEVVPSMALCVLVALRTFQFAAPQTPRGSADSPAAYSGSSAPHCKHMWRRCRTVLALASAHALQPTRPLRRGPNRVVALLVTNNEGGARPCRPSTARSSPRLRGGTRRERRPRKKGSHVVGSLRTRPRTRQAKRNLEALTKTDVRAVYRGTGRQKRPSRLSDETAREGQRRGQTPETPRTRSVFAAARLARRATHLPNTDLAAQARRAAGLTPPCPYRWTMLDLLRMWGYHRQADCGRVERDACGFTPNPLSTSTQDGRLPVRRGHAALR